MTSIIETLMANELGRLHKQTRSSVALEKERLVMCPQCHNVKQRHTWYSPDSKAGLLSGIKRRDITKARCPACVMEAEGSYGAEVSIHDVPKKYRFQVEWLIENEARNALYRDPQDRLLEVNETIDGYEVRTVSPKLARAIGQRIQSNFKTSEVVSEYSPKPFPLYKTNVKLKVDEYFN